MNHFSPSAVFLFYVNLNREVNLIAQFHITFGVKYICLLI